MAAPGEFQTRLKEGLVQGRNFRNCHAHTAFWTIRYVFVGLKRPCDRTTFFDQIQKNGKIQKFQPAQGRVAGGRILAKIFLHDCLIP